MLSKFKKFADDDEQREFPSRKGKRQNQDQGSLQARCPSSVLANPSSACATKAIYHVQELKKKLDNWCQQSSKFQPQMTQDKQQDNNSLQCPSRDSDAQLMTPTELNTAESGPLSPLQKKMRDVLGEVVNLVERLEADRQHAEEALQNEKTRKRILKDKVDSISLWKQQEHPFVVQKDQEVCITEIIELKCHLKQKREELDLVLGKVLHMEVLNQGLQEEIDFLKNHGSPLKENLEFKTGCMNQINAAQAEADKAYAKTHNELKAVEKELKEMELKASNEKASMNNDLKALQNQLANRIEELKQLKTDWEVQCAKIKDAEQSVALKEKECAVMLQRISETEPLEATASDQVLQLKIETEDGVTKVKKIKEQLTTLQEDIQKTKFDGEAEVCHLEELLDSKRKAFVALREANSMYEQEVQNYNKKISDSEKAVTQMQKDREQMLRKISENDGQLTQVVAQHSATKARLEEQELTFMEQQTARRVIEHIKRELLDKKDALAMLKSQCAKITEELHQEQRNAEKVNQELQREFEDASSTTKDKEKEIEALNKNYNDKYEILAEKLKVTQGEHRKTLESLEREKKDKLDHLNAVKELHSATIKRYNYTVGRIDDLTKKCTEYTDASDKMAKIASAMPEVIEELQSVFDVVEFKHQSAERIMSTIQSDINNCLERAQQSKTTHTAHFTARQKKMEDTKEALKLALEENAQLALEYTDLQSTVLVAKQEAVDVLSEKNHVHRAFHYYTQLSFLQKRMHKALVNYFEQRSLYSQAELDHCQALSQETNQKIKTAQEELSHAIQRISAFLQSLTDDSTTTDDASVNKQAGTDATGLNE